MKNLYFIKNFCLILIFFINIKLILLRQNKKLFFFLFLFSIFICYYYLHVYSLDIIELNYIEDENLITSLDNNNQKNVFTNFLHLFDSNYKNYPYNSFSFLKNNMINTDIVSNNIKHNNILIDKYYYYLYSYKQAEFTVLIKDLAKIVDNPNFKKLLS
jgi:hypothetical protein